MRNGPKLRVLDLFSGIGGFSLGLERTGGFETVAFCEIDPFCRKVLAKHWPGVPIHEDVRVLTANAIGPVDLICGGYPCQPFSVAGQRRGEADDRHLWPEMHRLVAAFRPAWVCGENVAGHINMGLDQVLSDLEGEGYTCQPLVIPACGIDAPHRRERLWILAHDARVLPERQEQRPQRERVGPGGKSIDVADAQDADRWRTDGPQHAWRRHSEAGGRGFTGCRLQHWLTEPDVGRVAHGVPQRVDRLRALGNAVIPQIPEIIGRAILEAA